MIVTLIRHTSVAVGPGICYGQTDVDVAASFIDEAAAVRRRLGERRFDAVFSSPLKRCRELAHYCGYAAPRIDARLMELDFGAWEMQAWESIDDPQLARWYADWICEAPSGGESLRQLVARVGDFVAELADGGRDGSLASKVDGGNIRTHRTHRTTEHERVAIFTHAGVIRAWGAVLGLFAVEAAFEFKVEYGDVVDFVLPGPATAPEKQM